MTFKLRDYTKPDFQTARFQAAPNVVMAPAPADSAAPTGFHAMSIFPEYFKIEGEWMLAEESRMDCVPVYEDGKISVKEPRRLKKGEKVILGRTEDGSEGIYVHVNGFSGGEQEKPDAFAFRTGRSRETAFSRDYDELYDILRYDRDHGKIVWVMGPAFAFDYDAREAFSALIAEGYVDAVLAGNALATHDLEAAYLNTALGQNIYTQKLQPNGHYNHLDTINRVKQCGSIPDFIRQEKIDSGIIRNCEEYGIPYVLAGSIRDDGPLPGVIANVYEAQDRMRREVKDATTVLCLATTLHSIAVGNMTPSFRVMPDGTIREVYFYCVDISEFTANKLSDRGSLSAKGIVTNVQDFIVTIRRGLGL